MPSVEKNPETDAIFDHVHHVNQHADDENGILRISLDSKAVVNIGAFSRGGKSRQQGKAFDHDFAPENKLRPFGILLPQSGEIFLWFTESKATADFMVDRVEEIWPKLDEKYNPHTLVTIELAYYPIP